jgi:dihydrofolate synthase/folylpolyglutamate synthase
MFSRMGSTAFKKDLTNIRILCERLSNPHTKFKTIHVGGTNGKGSVSHMLAAVLQAAGYETGLYTSPHLYDFRERIRINGEMVSESFVIDFVEKIKPVIEEIEPSFFEITVAMAFDYFSQQKLDVAVIEVGLGGRLDSTNIITPELSVITNIGWDHMNILGNTLEEIAAEKGGIIKENIPVVIGEREDETKTVFEQIAQQKHSPLFFAEDQYQSLSYEWKNDHLLLEVLKANENKTCSFELDLPGIYQRKNLCTVLTSVDQLNRIGFRISQQQMAGALKNVKQTTGLKGRWEVIHKNPVVVLEVAHNKEGIEQMLHHLKKVSYKKLHFIFGVVKDKDITKMLELLPKEAGYYFTQAHIPRALAATELKEKAATFFLHGEAYDDVNAALQKALNNANNNDLIIVCGSIFLVAEVDRRLFGLKRINADSESSGNF